MIILFKLLENPHIIDIHALGEYCLGCGRTGPVATDRDVHDEELGLKSWRRRYF